MAMATERWIRIRWETRTRYYEAYLHQDLFGAWVLTRVWGGLGSHRGQVVHNPCTSYQQGLETLQVLKKLRQRHGYSIVSES